ncbi:MAG: thioredoxin [Gaiellales bacterium]|nr:MAG: thioredoxin [Gaiellales bacterium]
MNKPFKLIAAALVMALAVFLFAGCGGGDEEDNAPPPKKAKTNNSAATASAVPSDMPESLIGQAVAPTKDSPGDFTQAIEDKRPVVVTFYMPAPYDDSQVRSSVMTLQGKYRGQVEFLSYLYSDAQSYKDLATLLKVNTTPTVVVINRLGVVQRAWTGYADEKTIEQGIQEALESRAD